MANASTPLSYLTAPQSYVQELSPETKYCHYSKVEPSLIPSFLTGKEHIWLSSHSLVMRSYLTSLGYEHRGEGYVEQFEALALGLWHNLSEWCLP